MKSPSLVATLDAWAVALGKEARTIKRLLTAASIDVRPGKKYTAREIIAGLYGEEYEQKVRNLKLDADEKERKAKIADGELVPWELVEQMLNTDFILPLIQAFDAAPDTVSREWIEKVLKPTMRQKLKQPRALDVPPPKK